MNTGKTDVQKIIREIQMNRTELRNTIEASKARLQLRIEESNEKIGKLEKEKDFLKSKIEKLERQQKQTGNKLIVDGKYFTAEQLTEIEQQQEEKNKTESAPATPTQTPMEKSPLNGNATKPNSSHILTETEKVNQTMCTKLKPQLEQIKEINQQIHKTRSTEETNME
ncbi:hypothetical protein JTB14_026695 [Gonioctena quinquepunctata]|nr:hypothetical protein JTB14_026695 [Gonioctena quinquepunctata]